MVRYLASILNVYIAASVHVALAAYALCWITLLEFTLAYHESSLYFVFFATITGYNFVKYFGLAKFHHRRLTNRLRGIQLFSAVVFVAMLYYAFQLNNDAKMILLVLAAITFLYAIPLWPKRYLLDDQKNLRQISGLKIYIIALVWTAATVIIPLVNLQIRFDAMVWITVVQRFVFILVLMLPFEIRDLNYDNLKLATLPQRIGVIPTKLLGSVLVVVFVVLQYIKHNVTHSVMVCCIVALLYLLMLWFATQKQPRYYSSFWVESIPIWWLALLLIFG